MVRTNPAWLDASLQVPQYPLRLSVPFTGIGGPDRALMELGCPFVPVNAFEMRETCRDVVNRLHGREVIGTQCLASKGSGARSVFASLPVSALGGGGG